MQRTTKTFIGGLVIGLTVGLLVGIAIYGNYILSVIN